MKVRSASKPQVEGTLSLRDVCLNLGGLNRAEALGLTGEGCE